MKPPEIGQRYKNASGYELRVDVVRNGQVCLVSWIPGDDIEPPTCMRVELFFDAAWGEAMGGK